jgi:Regulator of G protein signaling domain
MSIRFNMASTPKTTDFDLRKQFLHFLNQPDLCEQFYLYMKNEHLAYVLEFYLACDGLKNLLDDTTKQGAIIELIYKHYLSNGKDLSSTKTKFSLSDDLLTSIKQRLVKREFHMKFYEHAQECVLKYMLQMCYPKYLIEQESETISQNKITPQYSPMHRKSMSLRKKDVFDQLKQQKIHRHLKYYSYYL